MSLFEQVFADRHAYSAYDRLKNDLDNLEIEIIGAAADFQALQDGFKNYYRGFASFYVKCINSNSPQRKQVGIRLCRLEYENLYAALQTV